MHAMTRDSVTLIYYILYDYCDVNASGILFRSMHVSHAIEL